MSLKVVIADDEPITRMDIRSLLEEANYEVLGEAYDGFDAIELCKKYNPDLVIMDIKMPNLDGIRTAKIINKNGLARGVVLLSAFSDRNLIDAAKNTGVFGYLVKPLDEKSFIPTIEMAAARAIQVKDLEKTYKDVVKKLEDRKLIERAKGVLMEEEGLTEKEAYKKIRDLSMDKRSSMKDICEALVIAYE